MSFIVPQTPQTPWSAVSTPELMSSAYNLRSSPRMPSLQLESENRSVDEASIDRLILMGIPRNEAESIVCG